MPIAPNILYRVHCSQCSWQRLWKDQSDVIMRPSQCPKCGGMLVYQPVNQMLGQWLGKLFKK